MSSLNFPGCVTPFATITKGLAPSELQLQTLVLGRVCMLFFTFNLNFDNEEAVRLSVLKVKPD